MLRQRFSTVSSVGRAYELLVLAVLRRYSFQLHHSGRPGDGGVDFIGQWTLNPHVGGGHIHIVGQCKCHRSPLTPGDVREFEGVVSRMNKTPEHSVIGLMASYSGFSRQALRVGMNSDLPLIMTQIVSISDDVIETREDGGRGEGGGGGEGWIRDFVLNHRTRCLHPHIKVTWRHEGGETVGAKSLNILLHNNSL